MLIIRCPTCGDARKSNSTTAERRISAAGRSRRSSPTPNGRTILYNRSNPKGLHAERWRHLHGCGRFFNAVRDTASDVILTTYRLDDPKPDPGALTRGQRR